VLRRFRGDERSLESQKEWEELRRVGGLSLILAGALYLISIGLFFPLGIPPSDGSAFLNFVFQDRWTFQFIFTAFFFMDVLLVVGVASLYFWLRRARASVVIGCILGVVALTVDLVNSVFTYSLLGMSSALAASSNEAQRMAFGAAGQLLSIVIQGIGLQFFYIVFSITIIAISLSAPKIIGKVTSYVGVVAGVAGVAAGILAMIPLSVLWPVWFILVGSKLFGSEKYLEQIS
jgi:hypothetical protein